MSSILDAILAKAEGQRIEQSELFGREFDKVIAKVLELSAGLVYSAADPLSYDLAFIAILEEAGYYALVSKYIDDSYDVVYPSVTAGFKATGLEAIFTKNDLAKVKALKEIDLSLWNSVADDAALSIKKSVYKYALAGMNKNDMAREIAIDIEDTGLARYSKTYANTGIELFNQSVVDMKSEGAGGVWIYSGVNDLKTRPFCKCTLEKMRFYDDANKQDIQNDSRRRFNCRHVLYMVSKEYAEEEGYTGGAHAC